MCCCHFPSSGLLGMSRFDVLPDEDDDGEEQLANVSLADAGEHTPDEDDEGGPPPLRSPLLWIDLEMTGLDPERDSILEVAAIASDGRLEKIVDGPSLVVHQPEEVLTSMNEWSTKQHAASGLTERCRESSTSLEAAETALVDFVKQHCRPGERGVQLAGACVYKDKEFLQRYMPQLHALLSHRMVDVSSIRELARRWYPRQYERAPRSGSNHRALEDIRFSIAELQYYRATIFRGASSGSGGVGGGGGRRGAGRKR